MRKRAPRHFSRPRPPAGRRVPVVDSEPADADSDAAAQWRTQCWDKMVAAIDTEEREYCTHLWLVFLCGFLEEDARLPLCCIFSHAPKVSIQLLLGVAPSVTRVLQSFSICALGIRPDALDTLSRDDLVQLALTPQREMINLLDTDAPPVKLFYRLLELGTVIRG